jgi:RNA polymerase sigma-70 factor (ECF subfamily)
VSDIDYILGSARMPIFTDNRVLLNDFREGRRAALEQVYWAYVSKVEGIIRFGFVRSDHVAIGGVGNAGPELRDLVQEVFARAFAPDARRAYDGLRPFAPYLFAIARNVLADWRRRSGREVPTEWQSLEAAVNGLPQEELPQEELPAYADEATVAVVERFLRELPPELRDLHHQRLTLGLSQRDAADALGISRQNLRTLEDRLRSMLRQTLARSEAGRSPGARRGVQPAPGTAE